MPDEDATRARLTQIRAKRGTPERLKQLAEAKRQLDDVERQRRSAQSGRKTPENSNDMFGHPWPFWFQMRDEAMEVITSTGRRGELIHYGDLWSELRRRLGPEVGDQWRQLPILLGYVCERYHHEVGALPTAIVVSRETPPKPEAGFFRLAAFEGYLHDADAPAEGEEWSKMTARQTAFWREQVTAVFEWVARQA